MKKNKTKIIDIAKHTFFTALITGAVGFGWSVIDKNNKLEREILTNIDEKVDSLTIKVEENRISINEMKLALGIVEYKINEGIKR